MTNKLSGLYPTQLMDRSDAGRLLETYCDIEHIDFNSLPPDSIQDFLDTISCCPPSVTTETVAQLCGITRNNERTRLNMSARRVGSPVLSYVLGNSNIEDLVPSDSYASYKTRKIKPRRSEHDMMAQIVRQEGFPRPNFHNWSDSRELGNITNDWYRSVEYREQWIFSRREREGFNRRNIGNFSLDDVMARMGKRKNPHKLDTEKSKFYDWKLGGTDWIMQLELYHHEERYFLISRHIHKPSNSEIKFDIRYWNGQQFKLINTVFCEVQDNEEMFERVFGSHNLSSRYYVEPFEIEEEEECEEGECDDLYEILGELGDSDDF